VEFPAGNSRQTRRLGPFRGNLRHDFVGRKAHGEGKTELSIEVVFDALGDLEVRGYPEI
jgi:hypothetical protein